MPPLVPPRPSSDLRKRDIADAFGRCIKALDRASGPGIDLHRIDIARTARLLCRRPVCGIDARGRWTGLRLYRWWRLKLTGQRQRHRRLDDLDRLCRFGLRSEEHTSELQSLMRISYAVFCLKKKNITTTQTNNNVLY